MEKVYSNGRATLTVKRENERTSIHDRRGWDAFTDRKRGAGSKEEGRKPREGENDSTRNSCRSGTRFLLGTAYLVATKLNNRDIPWPAHKVTLVQARISRPRIQRDCKGTSCF